MNELINDLSNLSIERYRTLALGNYEYNNIVVYIVGRGKEAQSADKRRVRWSRGRRMRRQ